MTAATHLSRVNRSKVNEGDICTHINPTWSVLEITESLLAEAHRRDEKLSRSKAKRKAAQYKAAMKREPEYLDKSGNRRIIGYSDITGETAMFNISAQKKKQPTRLASQAASSNKVFSLSS